MGYLFKTLVLLAMTVYAQVVAAQIAVPELESREGKYYEIGRGTPDTGVYIEYFDKERKRKFKQTEFKNGRADGKLILWNKDGSLDLEFAVKAGTPHGEYKEYRHGKLDMSGDCEEGKCTLKVHQESGESIIGNIDKMIVNPLLQKKMDIVQLIGEMDEMHYFANGNKNSEKTKYFSIKDGKQAEEKIGTWTFWYENGQIKRQGNFRNGKKEGIWTRWDENGKIVSVRHYIKGELYVRRKNYSV